MIITMNCIFSLIDANVNNGFIIKEKEVIEIFVKMLETFSGQ